ncbi:MAG: hypothetical protein WEA36_03605 [Balneolaceae bacterium]
MKKEPEQMFTTIHGDELLEIGGGSPLSRDFFRSLGFGFELLNHASQVGAPRGNIYRHGG